MDKKTEEFLADLKADGFDVSTLETQINTNPVLEAKAKAKIGGSVLRQDAFTRQMQEANASKTNYENKVRELAAAHDSADLLKGNDTAYAAALEVIANQEKLLIDAGYDEEQIKELSYKDLKLTPAKKDEVVIPPTKVEDTKVAVQDDKNYIDADTLAKQSEMGVYVSVHTNALVNAALAEAQEIGVKVPREKILSVTSELKRRVDAGEQVSNIIDDHFGLTTGRDVYAKATRDKEIADARAEGKAEGFKESGVPARKVTKLGGQHSILDNKDIRRVNAHEKATEDKKFEDLPKNKYGDVEVFRLRRDSSSRIDRAMNYMDKVVEGTNVAAE